MLTDRRTLLFHDLTFYPEGDEVVVGRPEVDSYSIFPADGAALLRRLQDGSTLDLAAAWYQDQYGEAVDIEQFVATLDELGLVRTGDGAPAGPPAPVRWQRLGQAVFAPPAQLLWLGLVVVAIVGCVLNRDDVPARHDVFFTRSLLVIEMTILVGQLPFTLIHELSHVLAGRRIGVRSRLRVAHRFTVVVFETVLDGLVTVPRQKRYLPLAAGMLADLVVMAGLVDIAWLLRTYQHRGGMAASICLALAYTTVPRILWQFFVFLRTDVYYLLETALRCDDLDAAGRDRLRTWWYRRLGRQERAAPPPRSPRDVHAGRIFAPLLVVGYLFVIGTMGGVVGPLMFRFVHQAIAGLSSGGPLRWDAAAVLLLNTGEPVAARLLAIRDRRRNRRPAAPTAPTNSPPPITPGRSPR